MPRIPGEEKKRRSRENDAHRKNIRTAQRIEVERRHNKA